MATRQVEDESFPAEVEVETRGRRWRRHHLDVPIRVIVHRAEKTSVFVGRGNELSEGGLALTAGVELKTGDAAEIEFTPPYSGGPIRIRGVVRNRAGYRYGMEFVADGEREKEQVDRLKTMLIVMSSSSTSAEVVGR